MAACSARLVMPAVCSSAAALESPARRRTAHEFEVAVLGLRYDAKVRATLTWWPPTRACRTARSELCAKTIIRGYS